MILEAEKPHSLPFVSWCHSFWTQRLEECQCPRTWGDGCPTWERGVGWGNSPFLHSLFCLTLRNWLMPTHIGEGYMLCSVFQFECQSLGEHTHRHTCGEPAWGPPPVAKVMRKEARHTQRRDRVSGVPLEILEHLPPKPESAYFTTLCSHIHLQLYGGLSPTTSFGEGINLELQLIITSGRDRSVPSLQTPLKVL